MNFKTLFLFFVIIAGINSCRNDKVELLYPYDTIYVSPINSTNTIDYRDSVVGNYSGNQMSFFSAYVYDSAAQNYFWQYTYDTIPINLSVLKDNSNTNQIIIAGVGYLNPIHETFLQNDSNLYRVENVLRNDFGYFYVNRNPKALFLFLDNSSLSNGDTKTYSVTKQ